MWPLVLVLLFTIPAVVFVISIVWTDRRGAPWVPTSIRKANKMLKMAEVGPDDLVYDLGCGDGRLIVIAAWRYGARAVGIEIDPLRYLWCQMLITVLGLRDRVRIVYGDFFKLDLSDADVVTCFLLPGTNEKLEGKLKRELRPNTRVISNTFVFPGLHPLRLDDKAKLYLYNLRM
jgi:predicted RNA methylase